MPFGLRNATQNFQKFMDTILKNLDFVYCYIDDVIMSVSPEHHHEHPRIVLFWLQGLSINTIKCCFGHSDVQYLKYTINNDGCKTPTEHVVAIMNYKRTNALVDLRSFLGVLNYYRRCILLTVQHKAHLIELLREPRKNDRWRVRRTIAAELGKPAWHKQPCFVSRIQKFHSGS